MYNKKLQMTMHNFGIMKKTRSWIVVNGLRKWKTTNGEELRRRTHADGRGQGSLPTLPYPPPVSHITPSTLKQDRRSRVSNIWWWKKSTKRSGHLKKEEGGEGEGDRQWN